MSWPWPWPWPDLEWDLELDNNIYLNLKSIYLLEPCIDYDDGHYRVMEHVDGHWIFPQELTGSASTKSTKDRFPLIFDEGKDDNELEMAEE